MWKSPGQIPFTIFYLYLRSDEFSWFPMFFPLTNWDVQGISSHVTVFDGEIPFIPGWTNPSKYIKMLLFIMFSRILFIIFPCAIQFLWLFPSISLCKPGCCIWFSYHFPWFTASHDFSHINPIKHPGWRQHLCGRGLLLRGRRRSLRGRPGLRSAAGGGGRTGRGWRGLDPAAAASLPLHRALEKSGKMGAPWGSHSPVRELRRGLYLEFPKHLIVNGGTSIVGWFIIGKSYNKMDDVRAFLF